MPNTVPFCLLATRGRQREGPFPPRCHQRKGDHLSSLPSQVLGVLSTEETPACPPPTRLLCSAPGKGDRGDPGAEPGPHLPLPEPALKLGPHGSARGWDWASCPLGCFSASDLDLLWFPGPLPWPGCPTPACDLYIVVWTGVRLAAPPQVTAHLRASVSSSAKGGCGEMIQGQKPGRGDYDL